MDEPAQRPRSVRSVTSNSSLASTVSLARRPRTTTRARSRTVTGTSEAQTSAVPTDEPVPALPYVTGPLVQEPLEEMPSPPRPPRSPHRLAVDTLGGSDTTSSRGIEGSTFVVEPTQSTAISQSNASKQERGLPHRLSPPVGILHGSDTTSTRGVAGSTFIVEPIRSTAISQSKASRQASSLPHLDTTPQYKPPPSAFSRDPALTPGKNVRDSLSTEQSGMSSSLYPPSTSSASGPASPLSPQNQHQMDAPSIVLEPQEYTGDSDDVAYRLRLLVQNSYFLPPAHSKPSPADFAPSPQQKKASAPAFLDIFRMGKSRSKPTTPTGTGPMLPPMLRTTGDSITPAFVEQPRSAPRIQAPPPRGRVVVVREKMVDIVTAAKQAEQEVKARGARVDAPGSQLGTPTIDDDDIDPTDAVDVPLPPPSYPFAVQASALHGLGVADSVGAAVLADLLPPSKNPTLAREYDAAEDSWRKHILREAVGHSLDNTPDASISLFSQPLSPEPSKSLSLDKDRKTSTQTQTQTQTQTPQTRQTRSQTNAQMIARKITDSLPSPSAAAPTGTVSPGSHNIVNTTNGNTITTTNTGTNPPPLRKSSDIPSTIAITSSTSTTNNRISMKRNLSLPPAVVAEMEMLEGLSLSMPRPGSTLPPRALTPVEPQTPLGPPPRPPRVAQGQGQRLSSESGSPGGAGDEKEKRETDDPTGKSMWNDTDIPSHLALRRTVSTPSLAEAYGSVVERRTSTPPPLPVYSTATPAGTRTKTPTAEYRLSQATITSFNGTHIDDDDANDYGLNYDGSRSQFGSRSVSVSEPHESDYEQTPGRVSLALSAFPAPSRRTRSPNGSRSRSQSLSRPSLSQSEYSQASLSPTTSAFQEMLNHDHSLDFGNTHTLIHRIHASLSAPPSAATTPEPGASSTGSAVADEHQQEQEQRYATYIDAARLEAMSPPPRNSSSLAFQALPAPPRSSSMAHSQSIGNRNSASPRNPNPNPKAHAQSSYVQPRPGSAPGPAHISRSYSQPPVRRYPASPSKFASSPTIATANSASTTFTTPLGQPVLGPAPLAYTLEILAPEPTTPPLPPNTSFGDDAAIPALSSSATGTRSGTGVPSFFDSIQSHMDDLESSEDEDEDDDDDDEEDNDLSLNSAHYRHLPPPPAPPRTASSWSFNTGSGPFGGTNSSPGRPRTASVAADTSPRRPIMMMKHANFSAPYIRSPGENQTKRVGSDSGHGHGSASPSSSGHGHISSKHAVSNVAVKPKTLWQPASSDFFKYAQEHPAAVIPSTGGSAPGGGSSSAAAAAAIPAGQGRGGAQQNAGANVNAKAQESLRRFDGMLQQHIEAEKDTIKRIATTLKQQQRQQPHSAQDLNLPGRR